MHSRKFFSVIALAALIMLYCFSAYGSEREDLSKFITTFTEVGLYGINPKTTTMNELRGFGIAHICFNEEDLMKKIDRENFNYVISEKDVAAAVKKYFDITLQHGTDDSEGDYMMCPYQYENGKYYFGGPGYCIPGCNAEVESFSRDGNIIKINGEMYDIRGGDNVASFTATVKSRKVKGHEVFTILTLQAAFK